MVIKRNFYLPYAGKSREALRLIDQIRELTRMEFNKDYRILTPIYGHNDSIALELEFADAVEADKFTQVWYSFLEGSGWIAALFQNVQCSANETWTDTRSLRNDNCSQAQPLRST